MFASCLHRHDTVFSEQQQPAAADGSMDAPMDKIEGFRATLGAELIRRLSQYEGVFVGMDRTSQWLPHPQLAQSSIQLCSKDEWVAVATDCVARLLKEELSALQHREKQIIVLGMQS